MKEKRGCVQSKIKRPSLCKKITSPAHGAGLDLIFFIVQLAASVQSKYTVFYSADTVTKNNTGTFVVPLGKLHVYYILKINSLSMRLSSTPTFAPTAHCIPFHRSAPLRPSELTLSLLASSLTCRLQI